jgi:hypothetical protein
MVDIEAPGDELLSKMSLRMRRDAFGSERLSLPLSPPAAETAARGQRRDPM